MAIVVQDRDKDGKEFLVETYKGCVLRVFERNFFDDSDFYVEVYDEETNSIKTIEYATTRFWTYNNHARVDATDEVIKKVRELQYPLYTSILKANAMDELKKVKVGSKVRVVSGRKVPIGTEGTVVSTDTFKYGYKTVTQIYFKTEENRLYKSYTSNVEAIFIEPSIEEFEYQAKLEVDSKYRFTNNLSIAI